MVFGIFSYSTLSCYHPKYVSFSGQRQMERESYLNQNVFPNMNYRVLVSVSECLGAVFHGTGS